MKSTSFLILLVAASACASERPQSGLADLIVQSRVGFDSNPIATSGTSAAILGSQDTLTYAAGTSFAYVFAPAASDQTLVRLSYAGEAMRFDRWSSENNVTHRLGVSGQFLLGVWKFTGEASTLCVAGSPDPLPSISTVNANAITVWRERRRQWQHRARVQTQARFGDWLVRGTGTLLAYDYNTHVIAGAFNLADRSDGQGALDLGWQQNASSLWLVGLRAGRQNQSTVPLPNCDLDYSADDRRVMAGWEGKLFGQTALSFLGGPDFQHYTGAVDTRVFHGRDRTSLWFETGATSKPSPALTLTAKATRVNWLSSTGKSALTDSCIDTAAALALTPAWTLKITAKVHRCDYFPLVRDDVESLLGAGASVKISAHCALNLDVIRHRAWNNLPALPEREFHRSVVNLGAVLRL